MRIVRLAAAAAVLAAAALPAFATEKSAVSCTLNYDLKGWSAFYKTARGTGVVSCDNGQEAAVRIKVTGGGVTFGKAEIDDGIGQFSDVRSIDEVFGTYAAAEAHAGAVKSSEAAVYTKGEVSLALAGTGRGVNVGIAFGAFTIEKR